MIDEVPSFNNLWFSLFYFYIMEPHYVLVKGSKVETESQRICLVSRLLFLVSRYRFMLNKMVNISTLNRKLN